MIESVCACRLPAAFCGWFGTVSCVCAARGRTSCGFSSTPRRVLKQPRIRLSKAEREKREAVRAKQLADLKEKQVQTAPTRAQSAIVVTLSLPVFPAYCLHSTIEVPRRAVGSVPSHDREVWRCGLWRQESESGRC